MGEKTRKYLDYQGLETFWGLVKDFYSTNTENKAIVDTAKAFPYELKFFSTVDTEHKSPLGQTHFLTAGDPTESNYYVELDDASLGKVDGLKLKGSKETSYVDVPFLKDGEGKTTKYVGLDLSKYALLSDVAKVMDYKGSKTGDEIKALTVDEVENGDVYTCSKDDTPAEGEKVKFHKGFEYAAVVKITEEGVRYLDQWVELGNWIDLSPYKIWTDPEKRTGTKEYIDDAVSAEATARTTADKEILKKLAEEEETRAADDKALGDLLKEETNERKAADEKEVVDRNKAISDAVSAEAKLRDDADKAEASARDLADQSLKASIEHIYKEETIEGQKVETGVLMDKDKGVKSSSYTYTNDAINTELHVIDEHEIKKLFPAVVATASDVATLTTALTDCADKQGCLISLTSDIVANGRFEIGAWDDDTDVTIDLGGHTITADAGSRIFNVPSGSTLELKNGTLIAKGNSDPLIVARGKNAVISGTKYTKGSTVILDGVTMIGDTGVNAGILYTNGMDSDVNIVIKSGTYKGDFYLPAKGYITIDGGNFECTTNSIIYMKNGCPLTITGGNFVCSKSTSYSHGWAHYENGSINAPAAIVIEACNYGGNGNPIVSITGGTFEHSAIAGQDVFDVLCIDWKETAVAADNNADMKNTCVGYWYANVIGHKASGEDTEPTDGWVTFSKTAATGKTLVIRK